MHQLYILFEHASGYALFRTTEFEEIAGFLPQVRKGVLDVTTFRSIVILVAFQKFTTPKEALENMICIADGTLHKDLIIFLENNVPKRKKSKQSVVLGVQDSKLASAIQETMNINCKTSEAISEINRGIRTHFYKMVKSFADLQTATKAQLGLGHHYSRSQVKFNVHKMDSMITQSISMIDQLEKDITTLTLRVKQWYSFHFPELIKIVPDLPSYIHCVKVIKNRKNTSENIVDTLQNVLQDADTVEKIMQAAHSSMGMDIAAEDIENIDAFINQILSLMNRRDEMNEYLKEKMHQVAPNLSVLLGEMVGAQLISQAGNLMSLAKLPSSTVQVLGAEKALFRTLKSKNKSEKFTTLAKLPNGPISRYLANKCCIASKIDCFSVMPTDVYGKQLKQQVEDHIKFHEKKMERKIALSGNVPLRICDKKVLAAKRALLRRRKKDRKKEKLLMSSEMIKEKLITNKSTKTDSEEFEPSPKENKRKRITVKILENEGTEIDPKKIETRDKKNQKRRFTQNVIENEETQHSTEETGTPHKENKRRKSTRNLNK